jgi:Mitochondrial K+-H+ exchange-related
MDHNDYETGADVLSCRIPNLPFFYLVYRAWSHWRAYSGSKHVEYLLDKSLIDLKSSAILDQVYSGANPFLSQKSAINVLQSEEETQVLQTSNIKAVVKALEMPELTPELERAVKQVEIAMKKAKDEEEEKLKAKVDEQKTRDETHAEHATGNPKDVVKEAVEETMEKKDELKGALKEANEELKHNESKR